MPAGHSGMLDVPVWQVRKKKKKRNWKNDIRQE